MEKAKDLVSNLLVHLRGC